MKALDLFAGCGGLSLGFQKAGIEIAAAFERWEPAIRIYKSNFSHPIFEMDLSNASNYKTISALQPDMIIGGPPCQDFSSAGKRNENNGRGDLTVKYAEIVTNVHPEWFVMENVDRILKTHKLKQAKKIFAIAGYGLSDIILDASYCGTPQIRKRYFLIGKLNENNGFMDFYFAKNQSTSRMTIHDYFNDTLQTQFYYRHPRSYARRGIFSIYEPSPTIRGVNRPVPKNYIPHTSDSTNDLSKVRPLTTQERAQIQTFPPSFKWIGTKTDLEQVIGNAVPVNLAKFVGKCIQEYINNSLK